MNHCISHCVFFASFELRYKNTQYNYFNNLAQVFEQKQVFCDKENTVRQLAPQDPRGSGPRRPVTRSGCRKDGR
ncbi:hypothetical protein E2C01_008640 [Portunus trituberculatus]|uniref:Uncharacterized protein n=1 Tax=Portunus trituberculatus TaxID=210409 RepID=A0A5B7D1C4_PORTR|nr:hypothetical protein [Portunus trituberculatus]